MRIEELLNQSNQDSSESAIGWMNLVVGGTQEEGSPFSTTVFSQPYNYHYKVAKELNSALNRKKFLSKSVGSKDQKEDAMAFCIAIAKAFEALEPGKTLELKNITLEIYKPRPEEIQESRREASLDLLNMSIK